MKISVVKDLLIKTLEKLGYGEPRLQGSFGKEETYPESFITFFTIDTPDMYFYDNKANCIAFYFNINFYSSDPALVNTVPEKIIEELEKVGFKKQGNGSDLTSDYPTHTGWALNFIYQEKFSIKEEI